MRTRTPPSRPNARRYDRRILETLKYFRGMTTHQAAALCGARRSIYDVLTKLEREKKIRSYRHDRSLGAASIRVIQLATDSWDCSDTELQVTEALIWAISNGWRWQIRQPHSVVTFGDRSLPVIVAHSEDRTVDDVLRRMEELPESEVIYVEPDVAFAKVVKREALARHHKVVRLSPHFRAQEHPNRLYG